MQSEQSLWCDLHRIGDLFSEEGADIHARAISQALEVILKHPDLIGRYRERDFRGALGWWVYTKTMMFKSDYE
jgi:hypothetical protein